MTRVLHHFKARWRHDGRHDDPVLLYCECDEARDETRKVDMFADGRLQAAGQDFETRDTRLSEGPIPSLDEIDGQDEFEAVEITSEEFEELWRRAMAQRVAPS